MENYTELLRQLDESFIPNEEQRQVLKAIKEKEIARGHNDFNSILVMAMSSAFNYGKMTGKQEERARKQAHTQTVQA